MAQVKQIVARFGRKKQPVQYESAEAMLELTISANDDGVLGEISVEQIGLGEKLLGLVKTLVLRELGVVKPGENASASTYVTGLKEELAVTGTAPAPATAETTRRTRGPNKSKDAAVNVPAPPPGGPGENRISPDDLPEETAPSVKTTAKPAAKNDDLPEEPATPAKVVAAATVVPAGLTTADLKTWVVGLLRDKKISKDKVKDISREFGHERMDDVPVTKLAEYKTKVEAAMAETDI